jgi:hypothetical protein
MDAGYGGPVWHASVAGPARKAELRSRALLALHGVGAPRDGQWDEWTGRAFHLRRRLTTEEAIQVGGMLDIRGTPAVEERLAEVKALGLLPPGWTE